MRDAPYIEKAEREGMPHPGQMNCPSCGRLVTDVMVNTVLEVVGCKYCVKEISVDEWEGGDDT